MAGAGFFFDGNPLLFGYRFGQHGRFIESCRCEFGPCGRKQIAVLIAQGFCWCRWFCHAFNLPDATQDRKYLAHLKIGIDGLRKRFTAFFSFLRGCTCPISFGGLVAPFLRVVVFRLASHCLKPLLPCASLRSLFRVPSLTVWNSKKTSGDNIRLNKLVGILSKTASEYSCFFVGIC